jgi:hypothetical protein
VAEKSHVVEEGWIRVNATRASSCDEALVFNQVIYFSTARERG